MKTFTYVAAIALLTAGTAFAQSSGSDSSSMQRTAPSQSQTMSHQDMSGTSQSGMSTDMNSGSSMDKSKSMDKGRAMNQSRDKNAQASAMPKAKPHRVARVSQHDRGSNARENQETAQLNQQQVAQGGMQSNMGAMGSSGMTPQQAQAGGAACAPDHPDCGAARQNPAIQSPVQQRTYNAAPQ